MKKQITFLALLVFAFFSFQSIQAQDNAMKVGLSAAIPLGDTGDFYSFGVQGDFSYLIEVAEDFQVGGMASIFWYNGKKIKYGFDFDFDFDIPGYDFDFGGEHKVDNAFFLPIGATARYNIDSFFIGADLGYGIGLAPSGNDGGFFYRPKVGYDFNGIAAILSYSGIETKGVAHSSFNIGVEIGF